MFFGDRSTTKRKESDVVVVVPKKNKKKGKISPGAQLFFVAQTPLSPPPHFYQHFYLPILHFIKEYESLVATRARDTVRESKSDKMRVTARWCAALKVVSRR